jgi:Uma2 family endonuclease
MIFMATDISQSGGFPDWSTPIVHSFTVDDYHRLAASGVLGPEDRVELIAGQIYDMTPIGAPHATSVQKSLAALWKLPLESATNKWHIRVQQPVTLKDSEPQPDLAIVRGELDDYATRHPRAGDIGLVIEVADASLAMDRGKKLAVYAAEGIPNYWIVDLANRQVECYAAPGGSGDKAPSYGDRRILKVTDSVTLVLDGSTCGSIPVAELLV